MARDGNGTYSLPEAAFVNGTVIDADAVNSDFSDIASALTQSLSKDGQTTPTGNQPMGGFRHTGVAVAAALTDYARASQVVGSPLDFAADTGTATAYAIAPPIAISAYAIGQRFAFRATNANTGADPTLAVSSLSAGIIYNADGTSLAAGDITSLMEVVVQVADLTPTFHLQTPSAGLVRKGNTQTISGAKTFSNTLALSGAALNEAVRVDVASATTTDIGAAASNYVRITGTTTITGLGTIASGVRRHVVFSGALLLTYNATSLILPSGANITTVAGDTALFESEGSGNWRCMSYQRASGQSIVTNAGSLAATGYVQIPIGTDTFTVQWGTSGSLASGATSAITFTPNFSSACYGVHLQATTGPGAGDNMPYPSSVATTGFTINNRLSYTSTFFWVAYGK